MVSILASGPICPRFESQRSQKKSEEKIVNGVGVINSAAWRKVDSGLIEAIHLELASGKLALQKKFYHCFPEIEFELDGLALQEERFGGCWWHYRDRLFDSGH